LGNETETNSKPEDEAPIFQLHAGAGSKGWSSSLTKKKWTVRFAILSGRQGNQFSFRKNQINLGLGIIAIPRSKNRKPRIAHLTEETKGIVGRQMTRHLESPWLFPGTLQKSRHLNARWWYKKRFKSACERAGSE
jgi:hypothetical protein